MSGGKRTGGNIQTTRGQFGLSTIDTLTSDITLWDTYTDHPYRYILSPSNNYTITLPEITGDKDTSKCAVGHRRLAAI